MHFHVMHQSLELKIKYSNLMQNIFPIGSLPPKNPLILRYPCNWMFGSWENWKVGKVNLGKVEKIWIVDACEEVIKKEN